MTVNEAYEAYKNKQLKTFLNIMKKTDVLVIGSSAAGLVAATTGKRVYRDKSFTVVTKMAKLLFLVEFPMFLVRWAQPRKIFYLLRKCLKQMI